MKFESQVYTAASGSVGGLVYSHNRFGMYTRGRATPTNPNSIAQQAIRGAMGLAHNGWKALTQVQRDGWKFYADCTPILDALGKVVYLTGLSMYLRQFMLRHRAGDAPVSAAPVSTGLTELTAPVATVTAPLDLGLAFTNTDEWANAVGGHLYVFSSQPQAPTKNFFRGPYRLAGVVDGAVVPPVSPAAFVLPFAVAATQRVFLRAIACDAEGRLSQEAFFQVDAVAP
ncbi:MAG: hypothetical protein IMZ46_15435 [Acidobacteria bacterium]|nr:hypothetical protein [Acidobacteriota bacterium]